MVLLSEIARITGGTLEGIDVEITGVAKIEEADAGDITFLSNLKYKKHLTSTKASAALLSTGADFTELQNRKIPLSIIRVSDPYISFLCLIDLFHPSAKLPTKGIHPTAIISKSSTIGNYVSIGAYVVIGDNCSIGDRTIIYPNSTISDDVNIGNDCIIYSNVSIREQSLLGNKIIIHSGAVIGSDGFGFAPKPDGSYEKIPQRGIVVLEDDVEIGANCTIDRATLGKTLVKRGAKLDNLIHVAHNVVIGEHTVIAAQTGISGSSSIGNYCQIGGQAGLTGHISIADKTTIGAQSGVPKSITESGKTYFGYPAREIHETWRIDGAVRQLPQLLYDFRDLLKRIEELENRIASINQEQK
ncbi:MAG: UDP-3-O-(3-hydroxymyristoyl)glucosamine N-acyltransferase [Ignavibacteriales bacterium]|nr:UDP-3-O-(3-hydroxymyristoyl)glucosamine N-acyltransferase [Ignavibacteriales bacterium]